MDKRITVYIIDDHRIVRDGIRALLREEQTVSIVGESDGQLDLQEFRDLDPDIVLMDISLGKVSGIELTRNLLIHKQDTKVIILSMLSSEEVVVNAIEAGARGYLPKSTSKDEMLQAIREVHAGHTFYHSDIAEAMITNLLRKKSASPSDAPCVDCLSKREVQIIELYAQGYSNQEIADKLFISPRTVESHKTHIMQKLGFKSSVEMVKFAIKHKLIDIN